MKIATWNVNSMTVRLPHVLEWLENNQPDALCLQELKCVEEKFPFDQIRAAGYEAVVYGQPSYNGVAILTRTTVADVERGFPGDAADAPRRLIAATVGPIRVVNVYIPNGSEVGAEKYHFKLDWLARLRAYFDTRCDPARPTLLCGDFNVAPEDRDVHDPAAWEGKIHCSQAERDAMCHVRAWGFTDAFRQHRAEKGFFSWWDYRSGGFRRNHGLRIDHIWITETLAKSCVDCWIDKAPRALDRPSDHAPVVAEFQV
ncbi:MAG: exodeoxyribonuclease III [Blastocatellia bacterium]